MGIRECLRSVLPRWAVVALVLCCAGLAGAEGASDLAGEALYRDVVKYASFGEHRAGSKGDHDTSQWMEECLRLAGFETKLQTWDLRQFFPAACTLEVDGKGVECFPFWYPKTTGPSPLRAPLGLLSKDTEAGALAGRLAFVDGSALGAVLWTEGVNPLVERAVDAGAVGLIAVVRNASGEIAAINARDPLHQSPPPIPAVLVSVKSEAFLLDAATRGLEASLVVDGLDEPNAKAHNVVGTLKRGPKWVVVTTPTSGWFECAGERGSGVALFLWLARWAAPRDSDLSYLFLGNSGHELDNMGAHHSLDKYAPPVDEVVCWIHLGASIGTRAWEASGEGFKPLARVNGVGNIVGTPDLVPLLEAAFDGVEGPTPRSGDPVAGELRHFIAAGYRAFGLYGGHHFFHTTQDTPQTTSPELLAPVGAALVHVLETLEEEVR